MNETVLLPHIKYRKLRKALTQARQTAGMTQRHAAAEMDWSPSKVTRIERGEVSISTNDLRMLLKLYDLPNDVIEDLVVVRYVARAQSPWAPFDGVHSTAFLRYLEFEQAASNLKKFHASYIPGMLQTRGYCLATTNSQWRTYSAAEAELRWTAKAVRQRHLRDGTGPHMDFVLDEAAVRRLVGGPTVMHDQVRNLIELSQYPNVHLRVIPFDHGAYEGMRGPFTLLDFDDPDLAPMAYIEPPLGEIKEIDSVAPYRERFDYLTGRALSIDGSRDLLCRVETELAETALASVI